MYVIRQDFAGLVQQEATRGRRKGAVECAERVRPHRNHRLSNPGYFGSSRKRMVELLPVTGCEVTLINSERAPYYVAASNPSALLYEQLQCELGNGPCLFAFDSDAAVAVPDLRADDRFPGLASVAIAEGLAAVFALPLRHGNEQLGALDLYSDKAGNLSAHNMIVAQTLADVTAAYLLNARSRDAAREASNLFQHHALHDSLTGLPNRSLLNERLEHAALRARRSHTSATVLFADLDRFKHVNDSYGHRTGDELLIAVAHRLSGLVRPGDTVARVSGDEFVLLCEDLHSAADAELLARRITQAFKAPFSLEQVEITVRASIGVAFAGPGDEVSEELLIKADKAMYRSKHSDGASRFTRTCEGTGVSNPPDLTAELRAAFARNELHLTYQPIVRSCDRQITGVEALLRWTHPERGPINASAVVSAAEQSRLIDEIGTWILEQSCRDQLQWLQQHPPDAAGPCRQCVRPPTRQRRIPSHRGHRYCRQGTGTQPLDSGSDGKPLH